jgi:hypothetical protein
VFEGEWLDTKKNGKGKKIFVSGAICEVFGKLIK